MSDFTVERPQLVAITLRVPVSVWNAWEFRHGHYGKAIHALRENCVEIMGARGAAPYVDRPDPFHRDFDPGPRPKLVFTVGEWDPD